MEETKIYRTYFPISADVLNVFPFLMTWYDFNALVIYQNKRRILS